MLSDLALTYPAAAELHPHLPMLPKSARAALFFFLDGLYAVSMQIPMGACDLRATAAADPSSVILQLPDALVTSSRSAQESAAQPRAVSHRDG